MDSIEFAQMEKRVFDGLKEGNEVLKAIHSEMSVDAVEQLMDETREGIERQNVCSSPNDSIVLCSVSRSPLHTWFAY